LSVENLIGFLCILTFCDCILKLVCFVFQIKAKLHPVGEETTVCPESPCLPDGLSPFKKNFPDLTKCMSPSKKRKSENEASSTSHPPVRRRKGGVASILDDHTSTPVKRFTRQTRPISESEYSQVSVSFTIGSIKYEVVLNALKISLIRVNSTI